MKVVECKNKSEWDAYVQSKDGHPLQLWGWGEVKAAHGWSAYRFFVYDNSSIVLAAQVLVRSLPWPFRALAYVPRGPVVAGGTNTFHVKSNALAALSFHVKSNLKPMLLKIEPDATVLKSGNGWRKSAQTIQAPNTIQLDLRRTEDELLEEMTKKTRQYIRKSAKEVVITELSLKHDLDACLEIYKQTAIRADFPLHELSYYQSVADEFGSNGKLYGAKVGNELTAFLWLCTSKQTAFELYGGMTSSGQELRANYALKWHAIQEMQRAGVGVYDFGGLIGTGVSTFKKGWSEAETDLVGALDRPMSPWYVVWTQLFPIAKGIVRSTKRFLPRR